MHEATHHRPGTRVEIERSGEKIIGVIEDVDTLSVCVIRYVYGGQVCFTVAPVDRCRVLASLVAWLRYRGNGLPPGRPSGRPFHTAVDDRRLKPPPPQPGAVAAFRGLARVRRRRGTPEQSGVCEWLHSEKIELVMSAKPVDQQDNRVVADR